MSTEPNIHDAIDKFRTIILDKLFLEVKYENLINSNFLNSFNAQYGFMPYTSSLNKEEILGILKNFDLKTQAEFFDCYADFYKNSISPEILKYTQDLKICTELE